MGKAKTYVQMRNEFYENYNKKIVPVVRQYENQRKVRLILAIVSSILLSIPGLFLLWAGFFLQGLDSDSKEGVLKVGIFFLGAAWFVWYSIKKSFENKIKSKIMPTVCSCFGAMRWYEGHYTDNEYLFSDSNVVPDFTSSSYDDVFEGIYKDVGIEIIEAEYDRGSGKNRTTVFNGVIVKLDMNKNFEGHTVIKPDGIFHSSPNAALKHTTLEDVVFEKKFDVFTDDEVEARYLITTAFMNRLNNMQTAFKAQKVCCSFYNKYLLIALSTGKDLFSLCSLTKPIDDAQQYFQMYEEIVSIVKLIDHFKLNQRIGL